MAREIKDNWLYEYLRYTSGQESPDIFHLWNGMLVIAAALDRHVVLDRGFYNLYPNLYVILIGGAAIVRKTVSINIAMNILKSIPDPPSIVAQKLTTEALISAMASDAEITHQDGKEKITLTSSAVVCAPELSVFLGKNAYESGLLAFLTAIYDNPMGEWTYETKTQGKYTLCNPCLNLLGATTPEWLKTSIPSDAIGGGFLSRCMLIFADRPKALIPFPELTADLAERRDKLVRDLAEIRKLKGTFTIDPAARKWFEKWYAAEMTSLISEPMGEFLVRRPDTLLKLAMIISAAEDDSLMIRPIHLEAAVNALDDVKEFIPSAVSAVVTTPLGEASAKILAIIKKRGVISHRDLLGLCWRFTNTEGVAQAIEILEQGGMIKVERSIRGGKVYHIVEGDS